MKTILHCDLNNFFASVECRDNPELKDVPTAVCGSSEERKGIVLAKNEPAKAFGIVTGEPVWQAKRKCPSLQTVPPHFSRYQHFSREVQQIYLRYTDLMEPFGIDESWLDVTGSRRLFGTGEEIANQIREAVKNELGLTISVGVSFNKIFSKLGSDMKKPDAVTVITPENFKEKIWPLPVNSLLGVGKSTLSKLEKYRIRTVGDLAQRDRDFLKWLLGIHGEALHRYANALDNGPVASSDAFREVKSIGNSTTCIQDLENGEEVRRVLLELSQNVCRRLRACGLSALGVQITVKTSDFKTMEFQTMLEEPLRSFLRLTDVGFELFKMRYKWEKKIRAIGIRAIALVEASNYYQPTLFVDNAKACRREKVEETVDRLEERYGRGVVVPLTMKLPLHIPDPENKPSFFH